MPQTATLFASAARTAAVTNTAGTAVANIGNARRAAFLLDVTAGAGNAADTLDVYVDLSLDGTAYMNAIHFTQVVGPGTAIRHYAVLDPSAPAATTFNVTADCAAGVTKPYLFGTQARGRYTLVNGGDGLQSFTFSLTALLQ
jgi:hypothetical protein